MKRTIAGIATTLLVAGGFAVGRSQVPPTRPAGRTAQAIPRPGPPAARQVRVSCIGIGTSATTITTALLVWSTRTRVRSGYIPAGRYRPRARRSLPDRPRHPVARRGRPSSAARHSVAASRLGLWQLVGRRSERPTAHPRVPIYSVLRGYRPVLHRDRLAGLLASHLQQ